MDGDTVAERRMGLTSSVRFHRRALLRSPNFPASAAPLGL